MLSYMLMFPAATTFSLVLLAQSCVRGRPTIALLALDSRRLEQFLSNFALSILSPA